MDILYSNGLHVNGTFEVIYFGPILKIRNYLTSTCLLAGGLFTSRHFLMQASCHSWVRTIDESYTNHTRIIRVRSALCLYTNHSRALSLVFIHESFACAQPCVYSTVPFYSRFVLPLCVRARLRVRVCVIHSFLLFRMCTASVCARERVCAPQFSFIHESFACACVYSTVAFYSRFVLPLFVCARLCVRVCVT